MSDDNFYYRHPTDENKIIMTTVPRGVTYDKRYFDVSVNGNKVYVLQREIRGENYYD